MRFFDFTGLKSSYEDPSTHPTTLRASANSGQALLSACFFRLKENEGQQLVNDEGECTVIVNWLIVKNCADFRQLSLNVIRKRYNQ